MSDATKLGTGLRMAQTTPHFRKYLRPGMKALDVGAGNGFIASHLAEVCGCQMHCADIINYMECDLPFTLIEDDRLPFPDHSFDVAVMNDVLHHMPRPTQAKMLREATRVAQRLLIVETSRTATAMALDSVFSRIQHWNMPIPYTHRKSPQWRELMNEIGLECAEERVQRPWYYPLQHLFFAVEARG